MHRPATTATQDVAWYKIPPTDRRGVGVIVLAYVCMTAVLSAIGFAVVHLWEPSRFGEWDADVNRWFERNRTDTWTDLSTIGSAFSDTLNKVILCALIAPVMLWAWRRWHDWVMIAGGLLLEVTTFVTTATIVGRDRPPVERIDSAPTNSFPSGHIAASVVFYFGLYLLARRHTTNRTIRGLALLVGIAVPACMVFSRLYRGMHYPTDALAGILLGLGTLAVMSWAIDRTIDRTAHAQVDPPRPHHRWGDVADEAPAPLAAPVVPPAPAASDAGDDTPHPVTA
jgi:membrane-associated phospholipid phosphatase